MRVKTKALILSFTMLALIVSACNGSSIVKPTVTYIPPDWGFVEWGSSDTSQFYSKPAPPEHGRFTWVDIYYGSVDWFKEYCDREGNISAYVESLAEYYDVPGETDETGVMVLCGQNVSYLKRMWPNNDAYLIACFMKNNTFYEITIYYHPDDQQAYDEAIALTNSLEF